jgi:putative phosphoribosyl transferase
MRRHLFTGTPKKKRWFARPIPRTLASRNEGKGVIMKQRFLNRTDAGRLLATRLLKYAAQPNVVVLGLPPGGVPVAHEVARSLDAPLDALVVRKLNVPCQEELPMGAIAPGGVCVLNDKLIDRLDIEVDAIGAVRLRQEQELEQHEQLYRGDRPPPDVRGKTVIVIDDGIATGWTMHAATVFLLQRNAARVIVAAPVVTRNALRELQSIAAEVVAIIVSEDSQGLGEWFEDFSPITDDEVRRLLGLNGPSPRLMVESS